jgi:hypothetical protein
LNFKMQCTLHKKLTKIKREGQLGGTRNDLDAGYIK